MSAVRIVAIDGAKRHDSMSRKLLWLSEKYFREHGSTVTVFDQSVEHLPHYDDSDEGAQHLSVKRLLALVHDADAIILCSPEYHNSMSGAMKNALDWLTLLSEKGRLRKKVIGLMGGGGTFGNSGAVLQMMMAVRSLHGVLMPEIIMGVPLIWDAFDEHGDLKEEAVRNRMRDFASRVISYARLFKEHGSLI